MVYLYLTGAAYGVGTGIWIDALGKITDPGIAFIAPVALGAAVPLGFFFTDNYEEFHRGVPSSIATGMLLGGLEGIAVDGVQWQATGNGGPNTWSFRTETTVAFLGATGGGVAGYAFGEWLWPDPRSLTFIASGAGWGSVAGILFGAGIGPSGSDWKDGASIAGLIGYNAGILTTGALSTVWTPSWETQKYMWYGFAGGTLVSSVVYFFYLFSDASPRHGLIANSIGGLAGLGLATALTANFTDSDQGNVTHTGVYTPPFQVTLAPAPPLAPGQMGMNGAVVTAYGTF
jgi:hypothetical protein